MSTSTNKYNHYIVAIGASAGGLEAIHEFFDSMPDTPNISFIIIQHLSPDYKSLLVELVARHTDMKVYEAGDLQEIERKCVYVIPNTKLITIQKNKLRLTEKTNLKVPNNAIDVFLHSLAKERKERAIAVILSGTGTDGTKGTEAIKKEGGLVIAQDPSTAKFDGMPNSVIAAGNADFILPPSAICNEIISHISPPPTFLYGNDKKDDQFLKSVFDLIKNESGVEFHYYKTPTILRRITKRMIQGNFSNPDKYVSFLKENKEEVKQLGQDFLIGVTRFFRDKEAFEIIQEKVIPAIIDNKEEDDTIKIWVTACSTGEEAYTLAMVIDEVLEQSPRNLSVKIFASDLDAEAIQFASTGEYPASIEKDIDPRLLKKYFTRTGKTYTIIPRIRKQIVFARHNIIKDPPFIRNDLVSCRNMLIYISPALQQRIFSLLLFAAGKDGFIFLGPTENSALLKKDVKEISSRWKIYRKTAESKVSYYYQQGLSDGYTPRSINNTKNTQPKDTRSQSLLWDDFKQILTEDLTFVALYIDGNFEIRETVGPYEKFLTLPRRQLHLNLLRMVPSSVSILLSAEIRKAEKSGEKIHLRNVRYRKDDQIVSLEIFIRPGGQNPVSPHTMLVLRETATDEAPQNGNGNGNGNGHYHGHEEEYVRALESELSETKNHLQLAIEDLETTNEELQSTNEELLSANEELQSSNEELQSLNEELITLNTEHQLKIRELLELNDDLNNYFRSTDIAQVFLDSKLRIRKFNPASARMINFIDSDTGRPLTHISNNIRSEQLLTDVQSVLRNGRPLEKEVQLNTGKNLLMRIMPYLTHDGKNDGVIIAFVDITAITDLNNIIRGVFNSSPSAIFAFQAKRDVQQHIVDFTVLSSNYAANAMIKRSNEDLKGLSLKQNLPQLISNDLLSKYMEVVGGDKSFHNTVQLKDDKKWYEVTVVKMMDGFVATFTNITDRKLAEEKLRTNYMELVATRETMHKLNIELEDKVLERTRALAVSEERFRLVSRVTNDALWDWDFVNNVVWWSETFYKQFGHPAPDLSMDRQDWQQRLHPDDRAATQQSIYTAINTHQTQWSREYRFRKEDGEYAYILDRAYILHDDNGTPYRMLGSMLDITELKKATEAIAHAKQVLEEKVAERTGQLQQLNEALETSNHELQQFASIASHDLQEPLRKIHMFSTAIKDRYGAEMPEEIKSYFNKIVRSTDRMRSLIIDVLNFSRLSAEVSHFKHTDLETLFEEIVDDFEVSIREKKATVTAGPLPQIDILPGQFRQVLHNLLSNALKFTRPGVHPVIRLEAARIRNRAFDSPFDPNGNYYLFTLSDNGIGFEEKFADDVFRLFQRLHSKDRFEGTGIGLAITKKIIDKHNGLITVHSKEGEGTRFEWILPINH
ncbi:MAG: PAS domain-containing protein [Bacteroidetes bacterium]|nr:PAS domain-containing protein [Bacteroidota bacterium]